MRAARFALGLASGAALAPGAAAQETPEAPDLAGAESATLDSADAVATRGWEPVRDPKKE